MRAPHIVAQHKSGAAPERACVRSCVRALQMCSVVCVCIASSCCCCCCRFVLNTGNWFKFMRTPRRWHTSRIAFILYMYICVHACMKTCRTTFTICIWMRNARLFCIILYMTKARRAASAERQRVDYCRSVCTPAPLPEIVARTIRCLLVFGIGSRIRSFAPANQPTRSRSTPKTLPQNRWSQLTVRCGSAWQTRPARKAEMYGPSAM